MKKRRTKPPVQMTVCCFGSGPFKVKRVVINGKRLRRCEIKVLRYTNCDRVPSIAAAGVGV